MNITKQSSKIKQLVETDCSACNEYQRQRIADVCPKCSKMADEIDAHFAPKWGEMYDDGYWDDLHLSELENRIEAHASRVLEEIERRDPYAG